ncbi:M23 family metallopeptidase [Corynebacterium sp. A21]|uniref:M23 family metallopeptidase n=1 Tax=Corynebacterium sp. A21 TaxID=3457318 RepID=UPI003FD05F3F
MAELELDYPFTGRWLVQNSPANKVPSHGTRLFGLAYSVDFVPVNERGRTAPYTPRSFFRPEPPERFPGLGQPIRSPLSGTVAAAHDAEPDHAAYRGLPSVGYALTQHRRASQGWRGLAGNHVILRAAGPAEVFVALCHLRRGSLRVQVGHQVRVGDQLAECGNSGNSSEPHLHMQAMETMAVETARGLPFSFPRGLPRNGAVIVAN